MFELETKVSQLLNITPSGHSVTGMNKPKKKFQRVAHTSSSNVNLSSTKRNLPKAVEIKKLEPDKNMSKSLSGSISHSTSSSKEVAPALQFEDTTSSSINSDYNIKKVHNTYSDHSKHKKIGCTCAPCLKWDTNDINESDDEDKFVDTKDKCRKVIIKPPLLFKTDDCNQEMQIKTLASTSAFLASKGSKVKDLAILVHG